MRLGRIVPFAFQDIRTLSAFLSAVVLLCSLVAIQVSPASADSVELRASGGADAPVALAKKRSKKEEKANEKLFDKLREEYEGIGEGRPEEKFPALLAFGKAKCEKCVKYLSRLYKSEKNSGIHMNVTYALGEIASKSAIQAIIVFGLPAMEKDVFASESIARALHSNVLDDDAEKWLVKAGLLTPSLRKNKELFQRVLAAVAKFRTKDRFKVLNSELRKTKDESTKVTILEALEGTKSSSVAATAKRLVRDRSLEVQAAALHCLFVQGGKKYNSEYVKALKSRNWKLRVLGLRILSAVKYKKLRTYAVNLLEDAEVKVQIAAVRALMRLGGKESVEALITAMGKADARLQDDMADALARLTHKNIGAFAVQWESCWAVNKQKARSYKYMTPKEYSELLGEKSDSQTLLYHGLRVLSNYVAFVVDTSESMVEEYVPVDEREKKPKSRTEVKGKEKKENKASRMAVAKKELAQVVKGLKSGKKFNLIGFDSVLRDFIQDDLGKEPERLEPVNAATKSKAQTFIDRTKAAGTTHMYDALKAAFSYEDLDTVYLLSDGEPTEKSFGEILDWVRKKNRLRNVRINAIGFDLKEAEKAFLLQLTEENFGVFIER
ncbi:MAG: HEAT repeat domain-containing protein [Planctomycetota bacterium]